MAAIATLTNGLIRLLASTIALRCKTRLFVWSLPLANQRRLASLIADEQRTLDHLCDELAAAIAELEGKIPIKYSEFLKLSSVAEGEARPPCDRLEQLLQDHYQLLDDVNFLMMLIDREAMAIAETVLQCMATQYATCASQFEEALEYY